MFNASMHEGKLVMCRTNLRYQLVVNEDGDVDLYKTADGGYDHVGNYINIMRAIEHAEESI